MKLSDYYNENDFKAELNDSRVIYYCKTKDYQKEE